MENFNLLPSNPKTYQIVEFVRNNFFEPGFELDAVTPDDWIEEPDVLLKQRNPQMLEIATEAHKLWQKLTRQVNMSRLPEDSVSTLIPGRRFKRLRINLWDRNLNLFFRP